jgi:ATP-dependent DNA ligase
MHGHEFSFGAHDPTDWWISEKFDGVRAIWNKSHFISKSGKITSRDFFHFLREAYSRAKFFQATFAT